MRKFPIPAIALLLTLCACSKGNYPEAGSCSQDTPWYAVCTHTSHGLSGWTGQCRADKALAQKDAEEHAREHHGGIMRWTGVAHIDKAQLLMR